MPRRSATPLIAPWLMVWGTVYGCDAPDLRSTGPPPKLVFTEVYRRSLPPGFRPSGGVVGSDGAILFWSDALPGLLLVTQETSAFLAEGALRRPVGAAFVYDGVAIAAVDASSGLLVVVDRLGQIRDHVPLLDSVVPESAVLADGVWFVHGRLGPDGGMTVCAVAVGEVRTFCAPSHSFGGSTNWVLSPDRDGEVLVATVRAPFLAWRVDHTGIVSKVSIDRVVEGILDDTHSEGEVRDWVGLRSMRLDSGFLVTYADLRSDRRVLVLFDEFGHVLRSSIVNAPWGPVASLPDSRLLAAVRTTQAVEAVLYSWRWAAASDNQGVTP